MASASSRRPAPSSPFVDAWRISCEGTRALLEAVPRGGLAARYSPRTRTVAAQFAHVHYVRCRQLTERARLEGGPEPFPKGAQPTKAELRKALEASEEALAQVLGGWERADRVPSWGGLPASYLAYIVSHEAHHRALTIVALRAAGHLLPGDVVLGLWGMWRRKG